MSRDRSNLLRTAMIVALGLNLIGVAYDIYSAIGFIHDAATLKGAESRLATITTKACVPGMSLLPGQSCHIIITNPSQAAETEGL